MARTTRPLTHTEVQKAKALEKDLTVHDGDGLFLLVKTTGKKIWRFRYQRPGTTQRTMISLGAYPALSLADARKIRGEKLSLLAKGIDPQAKAEDEAEQRQIAQDSIFINVAQNWFALKQGSVSATHAQDIVSIPVNRTIHFQRSSGILTMSPEEIAMRKARFTEHQIIAVLKSVEAGRTVKDVCREAGISEASYYNWKAKFGGMEASDIKKMKDLEDENRRLKQMFADLSLECRALKDVIEKKL